MKARILVVEDEAVMRLGLKDCLKGTGYRVLLATNGEAGLAMILEEKPDLVLLDVMLPKLDGFEICQRVRELKNRVPILMLTAKGTVADRVLGLDHGADDYLVKPFNLEELLARIRALLRRQERGERNSVSSLSLGNIQIDFAKQKASKNGAPFKMTPKEFGMLQLLAEAKGEPISREQFLDLVWGYNAFPTTRTVDNHIASLRSKIEQDPEQPRLIKTVHGLGYQLFCED